MNQGQTSNSFDNILFLIILVGVVVQFAMPKSTLTSFCYRRIINVEMVARKAEDRKIYLTQIDRVRKNNSTSLSGLNESNLVGLKLNGISFINKSYVVGNNTVTETLTMTLSATPTDTSTGTNTPTITSTPTDTLSPTSSTTATETQTPSRTPFPTAATNMVTQKPISTQAIIPTTDVIKIQPTVENIQGLPTIEYTKKLSESESIDGTPSPTILTLPSITPGVAERTFNKMIYSGDIVRFSFVVLIIAIWGIVTVGLFILFRQRKNSRDKENQ